MECKLVFVTFIIGVLVVARAKIDNKQAEDQETAESGYGGGGGHGQRTQFHEQGLHGPHSYRFGYDTGDHYNPQTRYEERDDHGLVKGSYSFVDGHGKLQVVQYEAHPKYGFRAKGSFGVFPRPGHH